MNKELRIKFVAYIKSLYLPKKISNSTINSYYFEISSLSSTDVSENLELISKFFFQLTKKACCNCTIGDGDEDLTLFQVYEEAFKRAFEQIAQANLPVDSRDKYVDLLHFLNDLRGATFADYKDTHFADVYDKFSDMLFGIRFVFGLVDSGNTAYFHINDILADFILRKNLLQDISVLETAIIKTLYLALEIFRITKNNNDLSKLQLLIKHCNLRFLGYHTQIDQNKNWEKNYNANHVIILFNFDKGVSKVLIRSNVKEYFGGNKNVEEENNGKGKVIGYFIERELGKRDTLVSFKDVMKSEEIENRFQLTKLVFNDGYRNLFYSDYTLVRSANKDLCPVNLFSKADTKSVFENRTVDASNLYDFCAQLQPFYMSIVKGSSLDFVTFGLFAFLYQLNGDLLPECVFNFSEKPDVCFQNIIIKEYLKENLEKLPEMLRSFNDTFIDNLDTKSIESLQIYPIQLNLKKEIISYVNKFAPENLGLDNYPNTLVESLTSEGQDYFLSDDQSIVIPSASINNIESSSHNFIDGLFVIQKDEKYYYVGDECNIIFQLNNLILELNKKLIQEKDLKQINQIHLNSILKRMESQSDGLLEGLPLICCNQNDFFCMKILYHFYRFGILDNQKIQAFFSLYINEIPWLSFNFLKSDKSLNSEIINPETLIVFKDSDGLTGNTCEKVCKKYLNNPYRVKSAHSGAVLDISQDLYSYKDKKIHKIIFIFDNSITGKSVINALDFYINGVKDCLRKYRCYYRLKPSDNKEIEVEDTINQNFPIIEVKDIINKNSPIIEVRVLYYTEEAKEKIKEFLSEVKNKNIIVNEHFDKLIPKTSEEVCKQLKLVYSEARYLDGSYQKYYLIIREINQPKKNWLRPDFYNKARVYSLFIKQDEVQ
ncbi:hypothetical protein [uncultured Sphaerochaeta sp.]|uniref:hypothetical protein n=1 Tax=uncultured Sphaerochaeta sp. TaxID=886478 RepID=UPI002A0A9FC1|nr:hypothetical protein [uncultured Sphaerochaeta sp.]